jgi:hypothetical protein
VQKVGKGHDGGEDREEFTMIDMRLCIAKRGDPLEKLGWNLTATNVVDSRISVSEDDAKTFATVNTVLRVGVEDDLALMRNSQSPTQRREILE